MNIQDFVKDRIDRGIFKVAKIQRIPFQCPADANALNAFRQIGELYNDPFIIDNSNEEVYINLLRWLFANSPMKCRAEDGRWVDGDANKGTFLGGTTGTGKTTAIKILMKMMDFCNIKVHNCEDDRMKFTQYLATDICEIYSKDGDLSGFKKEKFLCIQDLGAEPLETLYMGNRMPVMKNILEARGDNPNVMTIITSNLKMGGEEMAKKYGDRVVSRLYKMCNFLYMGGLDRRK